MLKLKKEYCEFMAGTPIEKLVEHVEDFVSRQNGVINCGCALWYLKNPCEKLCGRFEAFNRLQARFFDVLDSLYELTPEGHRDKNFSFRKGGYPLSTINERLERCVCFYSLGNVRFFTGLLTCWAGILEKLWKESIGYGQSFPSEYREKRLLIHGVLASLQVIAYGAGPFSAEGKRLVVNLERQVDDVFEFFNAVQDKDFSVYDVGMFLRISSDSIDFFIENKKDSLRNLILLIVRVDTCFDALLNGVVRPWWNDLRAGGFKTMGRQYEGIKPVVDLFSMFPECVSYDENLFNTLYSLKGLNSKRLSSEFQAVLHKNNSLVSDVKKLNASRCPRDIAVFIDKQIRLSQMIYKKWAQNKKKFQLLEGKAAKREAFLKLFQGGVAPGDWEKSLFGDGGNFSGAVVDGLVSVLDQADFWRSRERSVGKIMGVFLLDKFHKNYASSRVQSWIAEIKAKKDCQDILNDMNL